MVGAARLGVFKYYLFSRLFLVKIIYSLSKQCLRTAAYVFGSLGKDI
jgi:hypothetical protein